MEDMVMLEIPVSMQTVRLLKSYAALSGKNTNEISSELGASVDAVFDEKLKALIAGEIGVVQAPTSKPFRPTTKADKSETVAFLGDEDDLEDSQDIPPSEELVFRGGLTDKDLDEDMAVENPEVEAKAEPLDTVLPSDTGSEIFAEAMGYTDHRIERRKKRFGGGRGKVKPLTSAVEAEGHGA